MTRAQGAAAFIAVAAVGACVVLIGYAGGRIYESIGPSKALATPDGGLYLVSHGALHVFGADGKRRESIDLDAMGVTRKPSDLAVHRDGRIVLASPDGSDLARCTLSTRKCERVDPRLKRVPLQHALPLNSVKIAIDDDRERYFLSDNAGHRVVATDFAGRLIATTRFRALAYPNQLAFDGKGELRVVDTNHQRIAFFDVSGDSLGRALGEMAVFAPRTAREGRAWPFDSIRTPAGETWVLLADDRMKDADLIVFDPGGRELKRIDLGEDSDPFDIELWGDRVIVSDATNYRVSAVALDGHLGPAFDDPAFTAELESAREGPALWRAVRIAAQVGIGLIPLVAILVLRHLGVPVGLTKSAPPAVRAEGGSKLGEQVHWIEMDLAYFGAVHRATMKILLPMTLFFVLLLAALYYAFGDFIVGERELLLRMGFVALALLAHLAIAPFSGRFARRQMQGYRLGASLAGFHYELSKGQAVFGMARAASVPWSEVFFDGRRLLAGRKVLPVSTRQGLEMFDREELRKNILVNIPRANLVTPGRLAWQVFAALGPWAWVAVLAFAGAMFLAWKVAYL